MAAEISRSPKMEFLPANVQGIHDGIMHAAGSQEAESIEKAIRSFDWISNQESYAESSPTNPAAQIVPLSGFVAPPLEYFNNEADGVPAGEFVSAQQLNAAFRNPGFRMQQGVQSFLQSGIQESLASVKPKLAAKAERPEILESLDDLMRVDQIKNLNASRFQPSMEAVTDLYSTLKKMQAGNLQLQANMLRMIRA